MIVKVLAKIGATVRYQRILYNAVAQLALLYESDRCVVTGEMLKVLEGLHHRATRRITGMTEKRGADGEWEYSPVTAAMDDAGLNPI